LTFTPEKSGNQSLARREVEIWTSIGRRKMSQIGEFLANMMLMVSKLSGGHLTRQARECTVSLFVAFVAASGFTHMRSARDIHVRHLRLFIAQRFAAGLKKRSLQNNAAHLRCILRAANCHAVADSKEFSNRSLGLAGASRKGTKVALSSAEYERIRARAFELGRPGMAAILRIEQCFGLRGNEAICSRSDTLERWLVEISRDGAIGVYAGTKGGRPRTVPVLDVTEAIAAVTEALAVAREQDGFLVVRKNGNPCGLKEAKRIYHGWAHRAGFQPHAARYTFAQTRQEALRAKGFSKRETNETVGLALGHGDGRGRWVEGVYGSRGSSTRGPMGGDSTPNIPSSNQYVASDRKNMGGAFA
jgi:hypothetical protein